MLERIRNKRKEKKGFTLIELIIVIAIIAILLALLVPNLSKFLGTAKSTAKEANAKSVYTSASSWAAELAVDSVKIVDGKTIKVENGKVSTGDALSDADLATYKGSLDTYLNGSNMKNTIVTITLKSDYSVTKVEFEDSTGTKTTYPKA